MKILLVQPAPFEPGRLGFENVMWLSEPVALTALAAMVPEHDVRIMDMRFESDAAYSKMLLDFEPEIVGTTSMTTDCYQAKSLLHMAKSTLGEDCVTIVGGHHPTLAPIDFEDEMVDVICLGEGEETFEELIEHIAKGGSPRKLHKISGLRFRDEEDNYTTTTPRAQRRDLDTFPAPARHLIKKYKEGYFFSMAQPLGSLFTSRGCSFNCNFCAIWEFYERRTRYLSAKGICDRLEKMEEKFVFFLDDNFLTSRKRVDELCTELKRRGIKKYFGIQARSDFIADNPDQMKRLRNAGLLMVLSGYENNSDSALAELRKSNTAAKNRQAAKILRDLGVISTGIFMVRPDFDERDFDLLYETINDMQVAAPIVTIWTPLPGTQLYKKFEDQLLTKDTRLYDLLHCVLPTKLSREKFYQKFAQANSATKPGAKKGVLAMFRKRPQLLFQAFSGIRRQLKLIDHYTPVHEDYQSYLRDEAGVIVSNQPPKQRAKQQNFETPAPYVEPKVIGADA